MSLTTRHLTFSVRRRVASGSRRRLLSAGPLIREGIDAPEQPLSLPLSQEQPRPKPSHPTKPPLAIPHHDGSSPPPPEPSQPSRKPPPSSPRKPPDAKMEARIRIRRLPYNITRTAQGNLPVYESIVNQNRMITLVRRVEGKSEVLRQDLLHQVLMPMGLTDEKVRSKLKMPGHIELKGHYKKEIVQWLNARGF